MFGELRAPCYHDRNKAVTPEGTLINHDRYSRELRELTRYATASGWDSDRVGNHYSSGSGLRAHKG